jgi:flagellar assembly protein FliH
MDEQSQLGYQEGTVKAEAELQQKTMQLEADFQKRTEELSAAYEQKMNGMEQDMVDAIIQVFDKVFRIQFEDKREILLALVANTLLDIDTGDQLRIRVNESDFAMLSEHQKMLSEQVGKNVSIEFIHDNKLSDGQCRIETAYGVFDCGIDTELSGLMKDIRSLI